MTGAVGDDSTPRPTQDPGALCYSAMLEQSVRSLGLRFQARIQLDLFEELFRRRLADARIRNPRALEEDFLDPRSDAEVRIRELIVTFRQQEARRLEAERERQRARLQAAERAMATRPTRRAADERRIATGKVEWCQTKLDDLLRPTSAPRDTRVFPGWYAPVVLGERGERVVRPLRYHLRPRGKPAAFDRRFPGLYNARADNLAGFWREQFGSHHGVVVATSFFENVPRHRHERRDLAPGESEQSVVVHFQPTTPAGDSAEMIVACLWDHWVAPGEPELWSFAAVTDEPPADVRAAGHDRCIVALRTEAVGRWLTPEARADEELFACISAREPLRFPHRVQSREGSTTASVVDDASEPRAPREPAAADLPPRS